MQALPVSTPPPSSLPVAAGAAADAKADPAAVPTAPPNPDFQAMLLQSLAGLARCAKGAGAPRADEDAAEIMDTGATQAGAAPGAGEAAAALLALLPHAAPSAAPGRGGDDGAAVAAFPADEAGGAAARPARALLPELILTAKPDPEHKVEHLAAGVPNLPDLVSAAASHGADFAAAAHMPAPAPGADAAAAGPAPVAARIATPLGAPGWSTALADQLVMFLSHKQQVAELHINPPHLGPVEITLTMSDDKASAAFVSPHAVVRETLEASLPRLREVLAESGIDLGQASVTADSPRDTWGGEAQQRQSFSGGGTQAGTSDSRPGAAGLVAMRARSLVDLFA